jgi:glycosyltransferase involved in cell wall biosynthesis
MSSVRRPIRIVHVITGLSGGGAERTMLNVARGLDPGRFTSQIVSLSRDHTLAGALGRAGIALTTLDARPFASCGIGPLRGVSRLLRKEKPDIVQTWLLDADLIGGVAAWMSGIPVIWNIRASLGDAGWKPFASSIRLRLVERVCAAMSGVVPRTIVSCSGVEVNRNLRHYRRDKIRVIGNGADTDIFKPDQSARAKVRAELGMDDATPLVGMVARFHPVKDLDTFLGAVRQVIATHPRVRFLLCGQGMEPENAVLTRMMASHGLGRQSVLRLGFQENVARIFAALDIHVLSSRSEAFGNALIEAMASGVPCVSTDVGQSRHLLGDTGRVVPPRNPAELAAAVRQLLDLPRAESDALRARARQRICDHFTLQSTVAQYAELYENIARL